MIFPDIFRCTDIFLRLYIGLLTDFFGTFTAVIIEFFHLFTAENSSIRYAAFDIFTVFADSKFFIVESIQFRRKMFFGIRFLQIQRFLISRLVDAFFLHEIFIEIQPSFTVGFTNTFRLAVIQKCFRPDALHEIHIYSQFSFEIFCHVHDGSPVICDERCTGYLPVIPCTSVYIHKKFGTYLTFTVIVCQFRKHFFDIYFQIIRLEFTADFFREFFSGFTIYRNIHSCFISFILCLQ